LTTEPDPIDFIAYRFLPVFLVVVLGVAALVWWKWVPG
jgi:hypothetical protein